MREKACCFTGHRMVSAADKAALEIALKAEISRLAARGVTEFYNGGAWGFDMLAAETVLSLRDTLPVHLHLILPCKEQDAGWAEALRKRYKAILQAADSVSYIAERYDETCMYRRNDALVDASAYCICFMQRERGGTWYTVRRARKAGLEIIHLLTTDPVQLTLDTVDTEMW